MFSTAYAAGSTLAASAYGVKLADSNVSLGIPGLGFSVSDRDERLPHMDQWVPRQYLERAYAAVRNNEAPIVPLREAVEEGQALHPLLGAALGIAAGYKFAPEARVAAGSAGALLGAGAGAVYNRATLQDRYNAMSEALRGAAADRQTPMETARAPVPKIVSGAMGN